jgi:hypothetical protein
MSIQVLISKKHHTTAANVINNTLKPLDRFQNRVHKKKQLEKTAQAYREHNQIKHSSDSSQFMGIGMLTLKSKPTNFQKLAKENV